MPITWGSNAVVTDGLTWYLDPANPKSYPSNGTFWYDVSTEKNHATLVNGPIINQNFITFDGVNDYLYTDKQYTNILNFTAMIWFRTSIASGRKILGYESSKTGNSASYDRHFYVSTDGNLYFGIWTGGPTVAISTMNVSDNVWRCATATYGGEGTTMRLYINGISNATANVNNIVNYTGYWRISGLNLQGWAKSNTGYFNGDIGQVMIYNRSLTASEVLQNYNAFKRRYGL